MYVCGITPYDATHMGHAATYVAFDLLHRTWIDQGRKVTYVQNVTDIDDPLLERASATGEPWEAIAHREVELFKEDMTALRVLPPTHFIGAVESIPLVDSAITVLEDAGSVYNLENDLYFSVSCDPEFGSRSHLGRDEQIRIFGERGGDPDRVGKKDPLDCLLWLHEREGEPSWPSSHGNGRPGWHIECVAIALHYLGVETIDVQGGGSDLAFPHHEMGAAQARVLTDLPYARAYVHAGMIGLDGEKMSKSKGNLVLVSQLRQAGHDPMAIRLALIAGHYRSDRDWSSQVLDEAESRLALWRSACSRNEAPDASDAVSAIRIALANDLNTAAALKAVDAWALRADEGGSAQAPGVIARAVDALLGIAI
jgi:L-cysteine:1D-myo-inositol 2-amino-2-deoxy-alpha-D-glucopyranoside ligase